MLRLALRSVLGRRRIIVEGEENIPRDGPLLVVSNHISNVDPLLFGGFFPGTLFAMAKRELFRGRLLGWFFGGCNVFPVDRGGSDRRALRTALDLLAHGRRLLIFVEGHRSRRPGMIPAQPGTGFLARRSPEVPILPVAVWGTEGLRRRQAVHLRCGAPFHLGAEGREENQAAADEIAARVAALLPPEYRGVHG